MPFFFENPLAMRLLHKNSHMPQPPLTSVLNTLEEYFDAQKLGPPLNIYFSMFEVDLFFSSAHT